MHRTRESLHLNRFTAPTLGAPYQLRQEILDTPQVLDTMRRGIRLDTLFSMEAHAAMLEKIYEDAADANRPKRNSSTPYLKLIGHIQQQVRYREAAQAELQERLTQAERAIHEKEALLQQTRRALEMLKEDHANLRAYLLSLKQTPLFKLQELLARLSRRP